MSTSRDVYFAEKWANAQKRLKGLPDAPAAIAAAFLEGMFDTVDARFPEIGQRLKENKATKEDILQVINTSPFASDIMSFVMPEQRGEEETALALQYLCCFYDVLQNKQRR